MSNIETINDDSEQSSEQQTQEAKSALYKTEMCKKFLEFGYCRYGDKCQFAHGKDQLRTVVKHPKYKTEKCKSFWSVGSCRYGTRCRFLHDEKIGPDGKVIEEEPPDPPVFHPQPAYVPTTYEYDFSPVEYPVNPYENIIPTDPLLYQETFLNPYMNYNSKLAMEASPELSLSGYYGIQPSSPAITGSTDPTVDPTVAATNTTATTISPIDIDEVKAINEESILPSTAGTSTTTYTEDILENNYMNNSNSNYYSYFTDPSMLIIPNTTNTVNTGNTTNTAESLISKVDTSQSLSPQDYNNNSPSLLDYNENNGSNNNVISSSSSSAPLSPITQNTNNKPIVVVGGVVIGGLNENNNNNNNIDGLTEDIESLKINDIDNKAPGGRLPIFMRLRNNLGSSENQQPLSYPLF